MLALELGQVVHGDRKLRVIVIGHARVGHQQVAGALMLNLEALVVKCRAIDGAAAEELRVVRHIACLAKKARHDAEEARALIVQPDDGPLFTQAYRAFLTRT